MLFPIQSSYSWLWWGKISLDAEMLSPAISNKEQNLIQTNIHIISISHSYPYDPQNLSNCQTWEAVFEILCSTQHGHNDQRLQGKIVIKHRDKKISTYSACFIWKSIAPAIYHTTWNEEPSIGRNSAHIFRMCQLCLSGKQQHILQ